MPRVSQKSLLEADLRERYGGLLSLAEVTAYLGYDCPKAAKRWLADNNICGVHMKGARQKYTAIDIAQAIARAQVRGSVPL